MKKLAALLMLATALSAPNMAMAQDVTIRTSLVQYSGHAAYLAVYLSNPDGSYNSTLWVSGRRRNITATCAAGPGRYRGGDRSISMALPAPASAAAKR